MDIQRVDYGSTRDYTDQVDDHYKQAEIMNGGSICASRFTPGSPLSWEQCLALSQDHNACVDNATLRICALTLSPVS